MSSTLIDFDPYRVWLGVAETHRPLSAYELLRLAPLESDIGRLRAAFQRQTIALERSREGADESIWLSLERELQAAIETLSDPQRKAVLDAAIKRKRGSSAPTAEASGNGAAVVTCRTCSKENSRNRRFCAGCGASLWEKCPGCNTECACDERFCGSCGTDIHDGVQRQSAEHESKFERAQLLVAEHRYEAALTILRDLAAIDDPRFESFANRALAAIVDAEATAAEARGAATVAVAGAKQQLADRAYDAAAASIERIPELLRDPSANELLKQAQTARSEIKSLGGQLRELVAQKRLWELTPKIERLLTLQPEHAQAKQLAGQLREHFIKLGKSKLASHQYEEAQRACEHCPPSAHTPEVDALADKVAELAALADHLKHAAAANQSTLDLGVKLVKFAPTNEEAAKLVEQLQQKVRSKPTDARHAAPDCATPATSNRLGVAVDHWGRSLRAMAAAEPEAATLLAEHSGEFFVAIGLALQGVDAAQIAIDLKPQEKSSVIDKLSFSFRKAKASSAWGIDLGSGALKAVKIAIDEKTKEPRIEACAYLALDTTRNESDSDMQQSIAQIALLKQFAARHVLKDCKIVAAMPSQRILGRFFDLPPLPAKKVADAIQYEAKHQIPIALDELSWTSHECTTAAAEGKASDERARKIVLVAARTSHVKDRLALFSEAGISVDVLQSEFFALHNAAQFEFFASPNAAEPGLPNDNAIALLDVGAGSTNVVVSHARGLWFRNFGQGGESFVAAVVKQLGLTRAQAEEVLREPAKARRYHQWEAAVEPLRRQFVGEVERSLASYAKAWPAQRWTHVYGCGGGFQLHGLLRELRAGK